MIEQKFSKPSQIGNVNVVLRIVGNLLYFKFSHSREAEALMSQFRAKGVRFRKSPNWLEVDLFGDNRIVKFGDYEIDLNTETPLEVEKKLAEFYLIQYLKSGFRLEE